MHSDLQDSIIAVTIKVVLTCINRGIVFQSDLPYKADREK